MKGIQSSGKSTFSKQFVKDNQDYKRVCRDDIRHMLSSYTFDEDNEKLVTKIEKGIINDLIVSGYNLVIDKMNLNGRSVHEDINFISQVCSKKLIHFTTEVKEFPITLSEALERNKKRDFVINDSVIKATWRKYEVELKQMILRSKTVYDEDKNLPHCQIYDIDGSMALSDHRKIFNSTDEEILNDKVIEQVQELNNSFAFLNNSPFIADNKKHLFILSGRSEKDRKVTEDWLLKNYIVYEKLIMRKESDIRADTIVKKEMFDEHIKNKYYCDFVVDDRPCVLEMWQSLGLFTFNVNQDVYAKNDF
jgi:predicted kinase